MKKTIALLLVLAMTVVAFAGCGGDKYADAEVLEPVTETTEFVTLDVPDGFEKSENVVEDYEEQGITKTETVYQYTESAFDSVIVTELTTADQGKMNASAYADYLIKGILENFESFDVQKLSSGKEAYIASKTTDDGCTIYNACFKAAADKVVSIEFKGNADQKDNTKMEAAFNDMLESIAAAK